MTALPVGKFAQPHESAANDSVKLLNAARGQCRLIAVRGSRRERLQIDPKAESLSHEIQTLQEEVQARLQLATMVVSTAPPEQSRAGGATHDGATAWQSPSPQSLHELQAAASTMQVRSAGTLAAGVTRAPLAWPRQSTLSTGSASDSVQDVEGSCVVLPDVL